MCKTDKTEITPGAILFEGQPRAVDIPPSAEYSFHKKVGQPSRPGLPNIPGPIPPMPKCKPPKADDGYPIDDCQVIGACPADCQFQETCETRGRDALDTDEALAKMCFEAWVRHHRLGDATWATQSELFKAGWLAAVRPIAQIIEKRERGFVRILEVLKRYCDKIALLESEIKEARGIAKELLVKMTTDFTD